MMLIEQLRMRWGSTGGWLWFSDCAAGSSRGKAEQREDFSLDYSYTPETQRGLLYHFPAERILWAWWNENKSVMGSLQTTGRRTETVGGVCQFRYN